jgi:hypothetical protein
MKKFLLALSMVGLLATMNSCKKDPDNQGNGGGSLVVEQKQRALVAYVGHSAIYGGQQGSEVNIPIFNDVVMSSNTNNIVGFTLQPVLFNQQGQPFIPYLQPFFFKDNNDTPFVNLLSNGLMVHLNPPTSGFPVNYFYSAGSNLGAAVDKAVISGNANAYVSNTPEIGIAVKASASGNNINITYKAKAFEPETSAEYYVSALVIEKSGNTRQAIADGQFSTLNMRNILRTSGVIATSTAGLKVPVAGLPETGYSGISPTFARSTPKNTEVEKTLTATYKEITPTWLTAFNNNYSDWKFSANNTAVIAIVWKWYPSENKAYYSNCVYAEVK